MLFGQPKQAQSATMALVYITIGILAMIWTAIVYIYLSRHEGTEVQFLTCYGFFFSGFALMTIGFGVGKIGRSAREAEVAPSIGGPTVAPMVSPTPSAPVLPTNAATQANATQPPKPQPGSRVAVATVAPVQPNTRV